MSTWLSYRNLMRKNENFHWLHPLVALVASTGRTGCIHWLHWLHPLVALVAPRTQNLENIGGVAIKIFWKVTKHNLSYSWVKQTVSDAYRADFWWTCFFLVTAMYLLFKVKKIWSKNQIQKKSQIRKIQIHNKTRSLWMMKTEQIRSSGLWIA